MQKSGMCKGGSDDLRERMRRTEQKLNEVVLAMQVLQSVSRGWHIAAGGCGGKIKVAVDSHSPVASSR